jgi:hypothetical protein
MTWQEELRQLDAALANGEVSAGDYRRRRDEILAAASSAQSPAPSLADAAAQAQAPAGFDANAVDNTTELADQTQTIHAIDTDNSDAEATQIVTSADSTQVVGVENTQGPTEAEQTQIITQTQQAPTWASHLPDPSAQTGSFPRPQQPMQPAITPSHAQEVFGGSAPQRSGGKGWLIAIIVVVVLALAGGGVWWFLLRDDGGNQAENPPPTTQEETQQPPPAKNIDEVSLPGEPAPNTGDQTIAEAKQARVVGAGEADKLANAGITDLSYSGSSEGSYRYLLYAYPSDDAAATTDTVLQVQQELGIAPVELPDVPDGVSVAQLTNAKASVLRAVYTAGDRTIQLSVLQVPAGSAEELSAEFSEVLATLVEAIPPTK